MMENLDKSMMRGQKIEVTMAASDALVYTSAGYVGSATKVRIAQRNKYYQMVALGIGIALVSLKFKNVTFFSFFSLLF